MEYLREAQAQATSLRRVDHRPWPLPSGAWRMGQTWRELLFLHWRVPVERLRPHVPERLEVEEFDGTAWLGITPFTLTGLRLRGLPPLPVVSSFYELNCRTYVRVDDRPGIWFFSLDASSRLAVEAARRVYRLPYEYARMSREPFVSRRVSDPRVTFCCSVLETGDVFEAGAGTPEHFLTERYCLYAADGRARADIHHPPWQLQRAEADVEVSGLPPTAIEGEPLCHFAIRQDVVVWPLHWLDRAEG